MRNNRSWILLYCGIFIFNGHVSAEKISLKEAISKAIQNNLSIIYDAKVNYDIARLNKQYADEKYGLSTEIAMNYAREYFTNTVEQLDMEEQNIYMSINIGKILLTPMGSHTKIGAIWNHQIKGVSNIYYQNRPQLYFQINMPLTNSGIRSGHSENEISNINMNKADIEYQFQEEQLIMSIIKGYYEIWRIKKMLDRAEADKETSKRIAEIAKRKYRLGYISEFEVINSELQLNISLDNIEVIKVNMKEVLDKFAILIGERQNTEIEIKEELPQFLIINNKEELIKIAYKKRVEMHLADYDAKISEILMDKIDGSTTELAIKGIYGVNSIISREIDNLFKYPNKNLAFQMSVILPISNTQNKLQLEIEKCRLNQVKNRKELIRTNIQLQVTKAYNNVISNNQRIAGLTKNAEIAKEALKIAEIRFNKGSISSNELEIIKNRLNVILSSLDEAKLSYFLSFADLQSTIGNLKEYIKEIQ